MLPAATVMTIALYCITQPTLKCYSNLIRADLPVLRSRHPQQAMFSTSSHISCQPSFHDKSTEGQTLSGVTMHP